MNISPEKKEQIIEIAGLIGRAIGAVIGSLIVTAIVAGFLYAILHLLIGLSITYLQVFGIVMILDFIKFFLKK